MRVLLVVPPAMFTPSGPAYVAGAIRRAGFHVHGHIYCNPKSLHAELANGYDVLATGGLVSQYHDIKRILNAGKTAGMRTILGGGIVTSEPELITRHLRPDASVLGQGEETAVELLQVWRDNGLMSNVHGLAYMDGDKFVQTKPRAEIKDIDSIPFPNYDAFGFANQLDTANPAGRDTLTIINRPREYPIFGSRSCPYHCGFCWHPSGSTYRRRSLQNIMDELALVIPKYGINIVTFYDELFAADKTRLLAFCKAFTELQSTFKWRIWWACCLHVAHVDSEILDALQASHCFQISYGFESYSATVLKSMNKRSTPEQIRWAVDETMKRDMAAQGNFIFGDPAETWDTAQETIAYWKTVPRAGISLGYIIPLPDSPNWRYCLSKGIIRDRLKHITKRLFYPTNMTSMPLRQWYRLLIKLLKYGVKYSAWSAIASDHITVCPFCQSRNQYPELRLGWMAKCRLICHYCRGRYWGARSIVVWLNRIAAELTPNSALAYWVYLKLKKLS